MNLRKLKKRKQKAITGKRKPSGRRLTPSEQEIVESGFDRAGRFLQAGLLQQAEEVFNHILKIDPANAHALHMLGVIAFQSGDNKRAVTLFKKAIRINPSNPGYHNNLGLALRELEHYDEAFFAYKKALRLNPDYADAYNNMGNVYKAQEKFDDAVNCYEKALELQPNDPDLYVNMAQAYKALYRYADAESSCLKALELDPDNGSVHDKLGGIYRHQDKFDEAITSYKKAIQLGPFSTYTYFNLAGCLERVSRLDEAKETIDRLLAKDAGGQAVFFQAAKIEYRLGNYEAAADYIEKLDYTDVTHTELRQFTFQAGKIYNRIGRYADAYEMFYRGNEDILESEQEALAREHEANRNFLMDPSPLYDWFSVERVSQMKTKKYDDGLPPPVCMVSFPRSGTTLLDQVLASHSAILTLEEKATLRHMMQAYGKDADREAFFNMTGEDVLAQRKNYWKLLAEFAGDSAIPDGRIVVDRNPFHTIHLGHIRRFFPEVKILFALRDPRDVCLSCFMQNFGMNPGTCNFLTLKGTAEYYARVMDLFFHFREVLPLDIHFVQYEKLVANLEDEARKAIAFLGLGWEDSVLDFQKTAKARLIKTASYHQVIKPIYTSAAGRWKRYEEQLRDVLPILEPYVKAFGYS